MATRPFAPDQGTIADTIPTLPYRPPVTPTATPIEDPSSLSATFHAESTLAQQDSSTFDDHMLAQSYAPLVRALGLPDSENPAAFNGTNDTQSEARFGYMGSPSRLATAAKRGVLVPFGTSYLADRADQEQLVAEQIQQRRLTDPKFLSGVPDSVEGLHQYFLEQQKAIRQQAEQTVARSPGGISGTAAEIAGGIVGSFHDPVNVAALAIPGGEGTTLLRIAARDALINGVLELSQQPIAAQNRAELGEQLTAGDAAANVASAAAGGAIFGSALHVAGSGAKAGANALVSRFAGQPDLAASRAYQLFAALPQRLKQKYGAGVVTKWGQRIADGDNLPEVFGELDNQELADVSRQVIGTDKMTPVETSAANVAERAQAVGASSPFKPGPVGDGAHENNLASSIKDLEDRVSPAVATEPVPGATPPSGADAAASAAQARPPADLSPVRRPQAPDQLEAAIASFKSKVGGAENATGNVNAKNPNSSASGPAQFTDPTFRDYYRRIYGADPGAHPPQNLKNDPAVQARLLDALTRDNAAHLQSLGEAVNDGNLYLEHFLGSPDAAKVFKAQPEAPIERIVSADVLDRNPFLKGKSASEVIAWAHGKMGREIASVAARPGFASSLDPASDDPAIAQLRAEAMQLDDQVIGATRRLDGTPVNLYATRVPASSIIVDADRFQFKGGGDQFGVTDRLKGVERWDPAQAGRITLWQDNDGRLFVADGHQRVGLAKRIAEQQNIDIPMDAMTYREGDGVSAEEARTLAALKNVAEGTGSSIDAAKVVRGAGLDALKRLPPKSALVRDAAALARLSDDAFGAVYNDVIPPDFAAVIGQLLPDRPEAHSAMVALLAKLDPANRGQAESIVRQGMAAGFHVEHQDELFGSRDVTTSLMLERAKVLEKGLAELRKMRLVHKTAAENKGTLEAAGSTIAADRSAKEAQANEQALEIVKRLAFRGGPVADALNAAARELAGGAKLGTVARDFAAGVRKLDVAALGRELDAGSGADLNGGGRGGEAGDAGSAVPAEPGDPAEPQLEEPTLPELEAATERFSDPDGKAVKQQADSLEHDFKAAIESKRAEFAKMDFRNPETKLPGQGGDRSLALEHLKVEHDPAAMKAGLEKDGIAMLPSQNVFRLVDKPTGVEILEDRTYRDHAEDVQTYGVGKGWSREEAIAKAVDYYFAPFGQAPADYHFELTGKGAIGRKLVELTVSHDPDGGFFYNSERNYSQGGGAGPSKGYRSGERFATLEAAKQDGLRALYESYRGLVEGSRGNVTKADVANWEKVKAALEKEMGGPPPASAKPPPPPDEPPPDHSAALDLGEAVDPNVAAKNRDLVQLGAEAPKRAPGEVDQLGEIGLPLMDAVDQLGFRLDEEGGTVSPKDLLDELDADAKAIKAMKDCL